ncbi:MULTISPECIES: oligoendopeptidase F [Gemella]|uniref:oligoendopeptidase F n=1 Tax=Gemella TaxID=1378 RepID=UPI0007684CF2|nr:MULTISPECIES: oligoendopeptidase F [Gemella]AME09093.1 oligopeptidase PepB [Gemella sp. oral taxon 928]AXI26665.1 oligoendopeptidase F [Gemella sp. ND 6198]
MTELLRKDQKPENTWDLSSIFSTDEDFWKEFKAVENFIPQIKNYQGKVAQGAKELLEVFKTTEEWGLRLETIFIFAHLRNDQDSTDAVNKEMYAKASGLVAQYGAEWSFLTPELLAVDENKLNSYLNELDDLKIYKFELEKINKKRPHTLDKEQEKLIAMASEALNASDETFAALNNTDVIFDDVKDSDGNEHTLTHGTYGAYMESPDRELRKNTFFSLYSYFEKHINTLASTLGGNLKAKKYRADTHKYVSTRNHALSENLIPEEVYDNLVSVVNSHIDELHKYYKLHKKVIGYEDFRLYDRSVSMIDGEPIKFTFEEARDIVLEAVKPMGEEYVNDMRKAFEERWIDIYPNKGKRSGAYSWGGYKTKPFILLNFDGTLNDVYTLIHELGHSMHSYYTRKHQPVVYGGYSIFVAEVASTCNEALLTEYLYNKFEKEGNKEAMLRVLNQALQGFVGTVFRQTQFAEFEHMMNRHLQNGGALTAEFLNTEYLKLIKKYYGDVFEYDEEIKYEWSRVPHFYYNYYVYQYATGYSAAQALSRLILEDSKNAKIYIDEFLSKGDSNYPIAVLKNAGVDMSKPEAIESALQDFAEKIAKFEKLYFEK